MRLLLVITSVLLIAAVTATQGTNNLIGIRKIYLGDFGPDPYAGLVKEKVRLELMKSARFTVAETPEDADAVLTGTAGVATGYYQQPNGSGTTKSQAYAILRLIDRKTEKPFWFFEFKSSFWIWGNRVSSVAEQLVEKLLNDAPPYKEPPKEIKKDEATGATEKP